MFELNLRPCYILGLPKSTKRMETAKRLAAKTCVIFPGALGDFLCFLPALHALAVDGKVDLFTRTEFAEIVPENINVQSLERYEISRLFAPDAENDARVAEFFSRYEFICSWHGSQQVEFVRSLQSVSHGKARVFPFRSHEAGIHQADYYLSCLGYVHAPAIPSVVSTQPQAVAWCDEYWTRHSLEGKKVLALAPGSGAREKNWPGDYFATTARWWRERSHRVVIALIGPVEQEREDLRWIQDLALTARGLTLSQVAALLVRADLYLGNDSGITHLAAAVGTQTIALFGPSDPGQWAPRGKWVTVLRHPVECSPCDVALMKECTHRRCLTAFLPDEILRRLNRPSISLT